MRRQRKMEKKKISRKTFRTEKGKQREEKAKSRVKRTEADIRRGY